MKQSWILSRANSPAKRPCFWAIPHSLGIQYALKYQSNTCNQTQSDNQLNNAKWYLLFEWAVVITIHSADWFLLLLLLSSTRWWLVGQHSRLLLRHSKCCSPLTLLLIRTDFVSLSGNMQSIFCKLIVLLLIDNHVSGSVPYGKFNESLVVTLGLYSLRHMTIHLITTFLSHHTSLWNSTGVSTVMLIVFSNAIAILWIFWIN